VELKTIFGLPAHPLIVHGAVVLLPLAALLVVVVALLPRTRKVGAPIALGLALAATLAVGLAQGSGEELEESIKESQLLEAHTDAGESVLPWAIGVSVAAAAAVAAEPVRRRLEKPSPNVVTGALVALALVAGVGATVTVIDVGHSGAKSVWNDTIKNGPAEGGQGAVGDGD
jgi:hypothetical protein